MKKVLSFILTITVLFCTINYSYAASKDFKNNKNVKKEKKQSAGIFALSKFFVNYEYAANNGDKELFLSLYSDDYISNDGFNKSILEQNLINTLKHYPDIKYKIKINSLSFYDDIVLADITETASGVAKTDNNNLAEFKSTMQSVYYLKPKGTSWVIVSDYILQENIYIYWGDAKSAKIELTSPEQIEAGKEYTAKLSITPMQGVIAIGSLNSDKITYPQVSSKEIFRKFSQEGSIERILKSNTDNVNEYVTATVGFTKPKFDENKNLDIKLSGYACIMRRMNVIPVNKFIGVKNESNK